MSVDGLLDKARQATGLSDYLKRHPELLNRPIKQPMFSNVVDPHAIAEQMLDTFDLMIARQNAFRDKRGERPRRQHDQQSQVFSNALAAFTHRSRRSRRLSPALSKEREGTSRLTTRSRGNTDR